MERRITVKLTCANLSRCLDRLLEAGIALSDVRTVDELTIQLQIEINQLEKLERIAGRCGARVEAQQDNAALRVFPRVLRHRLLSVTVLLLLALTVYLPTRVLFIRVEGNHHVPCAMILEQAEQAGVYFGADRGMLRSEEIKNHLLDALPDLQWVGVNTTGCVATVSVRERSRWELPENNLPGSMVAIRDGVVTKITAEQGNAACKVGDGVVAGQVLISGYTDCGLAILLQQARGEVFAQTNREISAQIPETCLQSGELIRREEKFSLQFGKIRINFDNHSGILDGTCVKMYTEYYLTLPGGLQLPVAMIVETRLWRETREQALPEETVRRMLEEAAGRYLDGQMVAGQVLDQQLEFDGGCLYGKYACLEMIGQMQYEEFTKAHGKSD